MISLPLVAALPKPGAQYCPEFAPSECASDQQAIRRLGLEALSAALDPGAIRQADIAAGYAFDAIADRLSINHINLANFASELLRAEPTARRLHSAADRLQRDHRALLELSASFRQTGGRGLAAAPHRLVLMRLDELSDASAQASLRLRRVGHVLDRAEMRAVQYPFDPSLALCPRALDDIRHKLSPGIARMLENCHGSACAEHYRSIISKLNFQDCATIVKLSATLRSWPVSLAAMDQAAAQLKADHGVLATAIAGIRSELDAVLDEAMSRRVAAHHGVGEEQARNAWRLMIDRSVRAIVSLPRALSQLLEEPRPVAALSAVGAELGHDVLAHGSGLCSLLGLLSSFEKRTGQLAARLARLTPSAPPVSAEVQAALAGELVTDIGVGQGVMARSCHDHWDDLRRDHPEQVRDQARAQIEHSLRAMEVLKARVDDLLEHAGAGVLSSRQNEFLKHAIHTATHLFFWASAANHALGLEAGNLEHPQLRKLGIRLDLAASAQAPVLHPALRLLQDWGMQRQRELRHTAQAWQSLHVAAGESLSRLDRVFADLRQLDPRFPPS